MYSVILMVITNLYQACNLQCIPKWGVARVQHRFLTFKSTLAWLTLLSLSCMSKGKWVQSRPLSIDHSGTRHESGAGSTKYCKRHCLVWTHPWAWKWRACADCEDSIRSLRGTTGALTGFPGMLMVHSIDVSSFPPPAGRQPHVLLLLWLFQGDLYSRVQTPAPAHSDTH